MLIMASAKHNRNNHHRVSRAAYAAHQRNQLLAAAMAWRERREISGISKQRHMTATFRGEALAKMARSGGA